MKTKIAIVGLMTCFLLSMIMLAYEKSNSKYKDIEIISLKKTTN